MKGGIDIKGFNWTSPVNFTGADDYGVFRFNNNIQAGGDRPSLCELSARNPDRRRPDSLGPQRRRHRYALRLLRSGRVASEQQRDGQPGTAVRAAATLRRPRREHQQFPPRHAERRCRRPIGGIHRPHRTRLRGIDRQRADSRGRSDRLPQGAAVHGQEQRRASVRPGLASERGQSNRRPRRLWDLSRSYPGAGLQFADRHPHLRQRHVPEHVRRRRPAGTPSCGRTPMPATRLAVCCEWAPRTSRPPTIRTTRIR